MLTSEVCGGRREEGGDSGSWRLEERKKSRPGGPSAGLEASPYKKRKDRGGSATLGNFFSLTG